ncbi:MAG: phosphoribulokinase [Candidatus Reddybacter sp.]
MSDPKPQQQFASFIEENELPPAFIDTINEYYRPLAQWINQHRPQNRTWIIGLNGAQGTGKSTLSALLKIILEEEYNCNTAIISLDDLYLPQAERKVLAQTVHPLLQTRGVPGTHDTKLGMQLLDALYALQENQSLMLPRFDKTRDDRLPETDWELFKGRAQVVIFEGWCVGSTASPEQDLSTPINQLEAQEDKNGLWRRYVNHQLQTAYKELFARIELLILLQALEFTCIHRWRWGQEQKLIYHPRQGEATQVMDETGISRFIQHFERLTRQNLKQLPAHADIVLALNSQHHIISSHYKSL